MTSRLLVLCLGLSACTQPKVIGRDRPGETTLASGPGAIWIRDTAIDDEGNVYLVGQFEESITLGPDTHLAEGELGAFVVSYGRGGEFRWSHGWSTTGVVFAGEVLVHGSDVYVLGYASGQLTTTTGTVDAGRFQSAVLLHFDRAGNETAPPLPFASAGGNVQGKALDRQADAWAFVGHYVGDVDLGGGALGATPVDIDHGAVGVFDEAGTLRWTRNVGGADLYLDGGALDSEGAVVACGRYRDGDFGGGPAVGDWDGLLIAFDATGGERWNRVFGSSGEDYANALTRAPNGDLIVVGAAGDGADFGGERLVSRGGADGFVARFAPDGTLIWLRGVGGAGKDAALAVAVADDGRIAVAGHFESTLEIAGQTLSSNGASDLMVFGLTATGASDGWVRSFGGSGVDEAYAVAWDGVELIVAGRVSTGADFGEGPVTVLGGTDGFVHWFRP